MSEWCRYRFKTSGEDYRPVKFPPPGPWWCSGFEGVDMAIIIAWVPEGTILMNYWPEAEQIEAMHNAGPPKFTDRFPRPDWYKGIGIDTILRADKALEEEK